MSPRSALFLLPLALALQAGKPDQVVLKQTYQITLSARTDGEHLHVSATPQVLSQLPAPVQGPFLSTFMQTAFALHESNHERGPLIVPFALTVRGLDGQVHDFKSFTSIMAGLDRVEGDDQTAIAQPMQPFQEQLARLLSPVEHLDLVLPTDETFLIDIAYNMPRKPKARDMGFKPEYSIRLGVAFCRREGESIISLSNQQVRLFEQARTELMGTIERSADQAELIEGLRSYLELVPSDRAIAAMLADTYEKTAPEDGYRFVGEYQPYFARWFKRDPYNGGRLFPGKNRLNSQISIVSRHEADPNGRAYQTRKRIRRRLEQLPESGTAWLRILEPATGDMVSGETRISFVVRQNDADNRLLSAFCLVDGKVAGELEGPPNRFTLNFREKGKHKLQVIACFADETRAEQEIEVDVVPTDESQKINLSEVQLIALDAKGWPTQLNAAGLSIAKGPLKLPIERVWRDSNPLDLVVLVDTSGSMVWRIFQAQYVIQQFLGKLGPRESASVYSFDEKVALVKRFENDLDEAAPRMFTMLPQGATALYDALLVAHCKLAQRQGSTKAIVVLGDGFDTASKARADEVLAQFEGTPIRVFSIQIKAHVRDPFLKDLAKTTGGRYWQLEEKEDPQQALDWTLAALRQLTFLSFSNPNNHTDDLVFKLPGVRLDTLHVRRF